MCVLYSTLLTDTTKEGVLLSLLVEWMYVWACGGGNKLHVSQFSHTKNFSTIAFAGMCRLWDHFVWLFAGRWYRIGSRFYDFVASRLSCFSKILADNRNLKNNLCLLKIPSSNKNNSENRNGKTTRESLKIIIVK